MRVTDAQKISEVIHQVAKQDGVKVGVAKARFAGEANYSVPSLERLMRGEAASEDVLKSTLEAVRKRRLKFREDDLFPLAPTSKGRTS